MGFSAREMRISIAIVAFRQKCKMSDTIHPSCKQQRTGEKKMGRETAKQTNKNFNLCMEKNDLLSFIFKALSQSQAVLFELR